MAKLTNDRKIKTTKKKPLVQTDDIKFLARKAASIAGSFPGPRKDSEYSFEDIVWDRFTSQDDFNNGCKYFYDSTAQRLEDANNLPDKILNLKRDKQLPKTQRWEKAIVASNSDNYARAKKKLKDFEEGHIMLIKAHDFIQGKNYTKASGLNETSDSHKQLQREYKKQMVLNDVYNKVLKVEHEKLQRDASIAGSEYEMNDLKVSQLQKIYDKKKSLAGADLKIALNGDKILWHTLETKSPFQDDQNSKKIIYGSECEVESFNPNHRRDFNFSTCETELKEGGGDLGRLCKFYFPALVTKGKLLVFLMLIRTRQEASL